MFSGREVVKSSAEKGGIAYERRFDCQTKRGMAYELEVIMANPLRDVALRTRHVTVGNDHLVALQHQVVHQVRADEACPASHQDA